MQTFYTNGEGLKSLELPAYPDEAWTFYSNPPKDADEALYGLVAMAFRAINMTADALVTLPYAVFKGDGEKEVDTSDNWQNVVGWMPNPSDLLRRWRMSLFMTNAAYSFMETVQGKKNLRYIVPDTIKPKVDDDKGIIEFTRQIGNKKKDFPYEQGSIKNRIIPFYLLDHTTELLPSKETEFKAMMNAAGILYYTDYFIAHFFKRGGVVPSIIGLKGVVNPTQQEVIERRFSTLLKNAYKYLAKVVNAEAVEIHPLGASIEALQDTTLYKQSIENVAAAAGIPLSLLLSNSATYATALEEKKTWFNNKVVPDAKRIEYEMNRELFEPYDYRFEFQYEASDEGTAEEVQRSTSISTFMDFVVKSPTADLAIYTAEDVMGYEVSDRWKQAAYAYFKDKEQKEKEMQQQLQQNQQNQPQTPKQESRPVSQTPRPPEPVRSLSIDHLKELQVWRDVALRMHKKGKPLDFDYEPHYGGLPETVTEQIKSSLVECKSVDDITRVFESVETVTDAPKYSNDKEIKILADALNKYGERQQQPVINITLPPTAFTLNEKSVTVTPEVKADAPMITVNVPEQPAPNVNITNQVETPQVNVTNEVQPAPVKLDKPKRVRITRDADGRIDGLESK